MFIEMQKYLAPTPHDWHPIKTIISIKTTYTHKKIQPQMRRKGDQSALTLSGLSACNGERQKVLGRDESLARSAGKV